MHRTSNRKNSHTAIHSYPSPPPCLFTRLTISSTASDESQGASPAAILGAPVPHDLVSVAQWVKAARYIGSGSEMDEPRHRPATEVPAEASPWTGDDKWMVFMDPDNERPQPEIMALNGYLDHYADARGAYIGIGGGGRMRQAWPRIRNRFSVEALQRDIEELKFDPVPFTYFPNLAPTSRAPASVDPRSSGPSPEAKHTRPARIPIRQAVAGHDKAGSGSGLGISTQSPAQQGAGNNVRKKATPKKGKQYGDTEQVQEAHNQSGRSTLQSTPTIGFACVLSMHDMQTHVRCLSFRFQFVSDVYDHLKIHHGFISEPLYLVEPRNGNTDNEDARRGLCKVCWDVFDHYGNLKQHIEEHQRLANENQKQLSANRSARSNLKFTIMQVLFAFRQPISEIQADLSIPFQKPTKPGVSKRAAQITSAADGPATKRPAHTRSLSSASMLAQSYGQSTATFSLTTPTESWTSVSQGSGNNVEANVLRRFSPGTIDPSILDRSSDDMALSEPWHSVSNRHYEPSDDGHNLHQGDRLYHIHFPFTKPDETPLFPGGQGVILKNLRFKELASGNFDVEYDDVQELEL